MTQRYRTIVADPPWPYPEGFMRHKGGRYAEGTAGVELTPLPYEALALEDIKSLPVRDMADKDSWLWLWTTNRHLPVAFDVCVAWGFTYRQTVVWHKSDGHPRFPATIAPNRAEYLLVCKRGQPERIGTLASNVIDVPFNPAYLGHSQKPEAFLDHIEALCPGPYLEMFARRARFGWDYWGDESLQTAELGAA